MVVNSKGCQGETRIRKEKGKSIRLHTESIALERQPPSPPRPWDSSTFAWGGIRRVFLCAAPSGIFTQVWLAAERLLRSFFITWSRWTTPNWINCRSKWANVSLWICLRILLRLPVFGNYNSFGSFSVQILLKGLLVPLRCLWCFSFPSLRSCLTEHVFRDVDFSAWFFMFLCIFHTGLLWLKQAVVIGRSGVDKYIRRMV